MSIGELCGQGPYLPPPPSPRTLPVSDTLSSIGPLHHPASFLTYARKAPVRTQCYSKEEAEELLPRCAACLQDFAKCQYPCSFPCRHIYCTRCLLKLKAGADDYKCPYDATISPVLATKCDLGFYNRIDYLRKSLRANPESSSLLRSLTQLRKEVNCQSVACRGLLYLGRCELAAKCPYNHSGNSLGIAGKFKDADQVSCWECKVCLLVLSMRLSRCPVCERLQSPPCTPQILCSPLIQASRPLIRKPTNATLDLSVLAEDEKGRQKLGGSELSSGLSPKAGEVQAREEVKEMRNVEVKASRCCALQ